MIKDKLLFGKRAESFTLQWHLTNACDLRCSHCYDRSARKILSYSEALGVLDQMDRFCDAKQVKKQICLTGGNPFYYPNFFELYAEIQRRGAAISILGNPVTESQLDRLLEIQRPTYFQVSLEGLEDHNDQIRGTGHFKRTTEFLGLLREKNIRAHVMLTLTDQNMDQVIALGDYLKDKADRYTFNRLSQSGSGAALGLPQKSKYIEFLKDYSKASRTNRVLAFKDGLFNIFRYHYGRPKIHGCTGHGCGAAFNFVALLPDGEVHACRKFESPLGRIQDSTLTEIYENKTSAQYRKGCGECQFCPLKKVCGGCMAVVHGQGHDVFKTRDPYCFMKERNEVCAEF
jgi:selenobiotic family peptide radical SAM maturase